MGSYVTKLTSWRLSLPKWEIVSKCALMGKVRKVLHLQSWKHETQWRMLGQDWVINASALLFPPKKDWLVFFLRMVMIMVMTRYSVLVILHHKKVFSSCTWYKDVTRRFFGTQQLLWASWMWAHTLNFPRIRLPWMLFSLKPLPDLEHFISLLYARQTEWWMFISFYCRRLSTTFEKRRWRRHKRTEVSSVAQVHQIEYFLDVRIGETRKRTKPTFLCLINVALAK